MRAQREEDSQREASRAQNPENRERKEKAGPTAGAAPAAKVASAAVEVGDRASSAPRFGATAQGNKQRQLAKRHARCARSGGAERPEEPDRMARIH